MPSSSPSIFHSPVASSPALGKKAGKAREWDGEIPCVASSCSAFAPLPPWSLFLHEQLKLSSVIVLTVHWGWVLQISPLTRITPGTSLSQPRAARLSHSIDTNFMTVIALLFV